MDIKKWATENMLVLTLAGSRLYGTSRPESDYDYRGVCLDPPSTILGIQNFGQHENITKSYDEVVYSASKFLRLVLDANPSILDVLFAPDSAIIEMSPSWAAVRNDAPLFLSQKARWTFSGYAMSQLKRIQRHKKWIDDPPSEPTLEQYNLVLVNKPLGAQVIRGNGTGDEMLNIKLHKEAVAEYKRYMTWKANRNPERAKLEELYGYDVKHAAHLVRLLMQGENILRDGTYNPVLTGEILENIQEVLSGKWTYDGLLTYAEVLDNFIRMMPSVLPKRPDVSLAEKHIRRLSVESLCSDEYFIAAIAERGGCA